MLENLSYQYLTYQKNSIEQKEHNYSFKQVRK